VTRRRAPDGAVPLVSDIISTGFRKHFFLGRLPAVMRLFLIGEKGNQTQLKPEATPQKGHADLFYKSALQKH
jgi:hypothetical protein